MIRYIFLYFFILIGCSAIGQNLVPNSSFEIFTTCPTTYSQQQYSPPWSSFGSSDYFNTCNNSINGLMGVPQNHFGYQYPFEGNAYSGIISRGAGGWEFLKVKLIQPLDSGKKYCIRFYVNLSDSSSWAVDSIGALLSDTNLNLATPFLIIPQVLYHPYITDKENWVLVEGEVIANGNEELLTIGNFGHIINSGPDLYVSGGCVYDLIDNPDCISCYYYIDSVSVTLCPDPAPPSPPTEGGLTIPNVFTPNGDGINDVFTIESTGIESIYCEIFNRWGIKVATLSRVNEGWDGRTTSGQEATEGVYYYVVTAKGTDSKEHRKTGFIQLLR